MGVSYSLPGALRAARLQRPPDRADRFGDEVVWMTGKHASRVVAAARSLVRAGAG
jgi:hypothetical protein